LIATIYVGTPKGRHVHELGPQVVNVLIPGPAALLPGISLTVLLTPTVGGLLSKTASGEVVAKALVAILETGVSETLLAAVLEALLGSHLIDDLDVSLLFGQTS
jgi:hypothetical protein